jgi:hypothetical protein
MIEGSGIVPRTNGFGSDSGSATLAALVRLRVIIIVVKIPHPYKKNGAILTSPCLSCPTTVIPDGPSSPCPSGPNGSTRPPTSGPNFHVVLIQVVPV